MRGIVTRFCVVVLMIVGVLADTTTVFTAPFAYIPSNSSNSIVVVDQQTNKVVTTIPVGFYPRGIAVNAAGSRVYVVNVDSRTVSVIDGISNAIIGSPIPVGAHPNGIVVSPDNSTVYVANTVDNTILVINAQNNTVIDIIPGVPSFSLAIHPSGSFLYAADSNRQEIRVIETATRTVVGDSHNSID